METADSPALLVLDLPPAALVGIDLLSFTATPKFRGIKNLPSGLHFVFVGSSTAFSERHGVWFEVPSKPTASDLPLLVTKWDPSTETLHRVTDSQDILRQRANLGKLWREGLAPYRQQTSNASGSSTDMTQQQQEEISNWPSLTSSITPSLLYRITTNGHLSSASSSRADLEAIPGLTPTTSTISDLNDFEELHFLSISLRQTWREGATGRERTNAAQDRSWALENLITSSSISSEDEVIGELQFAFLMILTLNNFSCLEQWKRILSLLFTCKLSVPKRTDLFISAIATLRLQLQHCKDAEGELIDLTDESGNLLKDLLVRFRRGITSLPPSAGEDVQDVLDELTDLEDYLQTEHGWAFGGAFAKSGVLELEDGEQVEMRTTAFDEEDETGEFAPTVVELSEEQRKALGVGDEIVLHEGLGKVVLGGKEGSSNAGGLAMEEASSGEEGSIDDDDDAGGGPESDDDEEEMDDLDEMDARY